MLDKLQQGPSRSPRRELDTTGIRGDETDNRAGLRKVLWKKTLKMKKIHAADEFGRFFVTGRLDASSEASHFYCRLCRKDVSVLTDRPREILRYFQGVSALPKTKGCALRHVAGVFWISRTIH